MIPTPLLPCDRQPSAADTEVSAAERDLGLALPSDYRAFLRETNGLEGFVAPEAYLILWSLLDLHALNEAYAVSEFPPGVTLIGTDGGENRYEFRFRDGHIEDVSTPLVGMEPSSLTVMGASLA